MRRSEEGIVGSRTKWYHVPPLGVCVLSASFMSKPPKLRHWVTLRVSYQPPADVEQLIQEKGARLLKRHEGRGVSAEDEG